MPNGTSYVIPSANTGTAVFFVSSGFYQTGSIPRRPGQMTYGTGPASDLGLPNDSATTFSRSCRRMHGGAFHRSNRGCSHEDDDKEGRQQHRHGEGTEAVQRVSNRVEDQGDHSFHDSGNETSERGECARSAQRTDDHRKRNWRFTRDCSSKRDVCADDTPGHQSHACVGAAKRRGYN